jgi:hypothetical protein
MSEFKNLTPDFKIKVRKIVQTDNLYCVHTLEFSKSTKFPDKEIVSFPSYKGTDLKSGGYCRLI